MTQSNSSRPHRVAGPRRRSATTRLRATPEQLEPRRLLTGYYPAVGDYDGDGISDIAVFRYSSNGTTQVNGRNAIEMQLSKSGAATGYEMGYTATDRPTPADFDGDGKADSAVYGFLDDVTYGNYYGTTTAPVSQPFPNGSGRFAYIPSSGVYPAAITGAVNGTMNIPDAKVVIVNIGSAGDLAAVADYDGDGKADFAVYEPSKAQFLYIPSSTFNPTGNPNAAGNAPVTVPLGRVGDVPASADYLGTGKAQFAVYDAATGTFFVRSPDGNTVTTATLGGPGDIPVPGDYEGLGHADYAVYDPTHGVFLLRPANGSATQTFTVGDPGDTPAVGRYGDGRVDFATFNPATLQFHYLAMGSGVQTKTLPDPDAIGIRRTDDYSVNLHNQYVARTQDANVMFLGDSITANWPYNGSASWNSRITPLGVVNNGDNYDTTQNVLWRITNGELKVHPKVIVLEAGTNDFTDRSPAQVAHTLGVIIDQIHAELPGTSILLMGVFPRAEMTPDLSSYLRTYYAYINAEISDLDEHYIPALAKPFSARSLQTYPAGDYSIDLRPYLSADPSDPNNYYSNPTYTLDLVHPNQVGYGVWTAAIATPLRLLLHRPLVPADYDGDGRTDISIYEPAAGGFAGLASASGIDGFYPFGVPGAGQSLMAPGDYDGDGRTDYAVYQPAIGAFAITNSSTFKSGYIKFGPSGSGQSLPAAGDYDGDGKTDLAVYLPTVGAFAVRPSAGGPDSVVAFGSAGAGQSIPAPGDYDGDGKTDLAVYLPALGGFGIRPSSGGPDVIVRFGIAGAGQSIPAPGDYDGDGKTDLAVYMPALGAFAIRPSTGGPDRILPFGLPGIGQSIPAPGDYDGDGRTDLAVYLPALHSFGIRFTKLGIDAILSYGPGKPGQSIPVTSSASLVVNGPLGQYTTNAFVAAAQVAAGASTAAVSASPATTLGGATAAGRSTPIRTAQGRYTTARVNQAIPSGPRVAARASSPTTRDPRQEV